VDCDKPANNGCNGGVMDYAYYFIISNGGIDSESDYPYQGEETQCDNEKVCGTIISVPRVIMKRIEVTISKKKSQHFILKLSYRFVLGLLLT